MAAIQGDGEHVAWCDSVAARLACAFNGVVDHWGRVDCAEMETHRAYEGRSLRDLADATGRCPFLRCVRLIASCPHHEAARAQCRREQPVRQAASDRRRRTEPDEPHALR